LTANVFVLIFLEVSVLPGKNMMRILVSVLQYLAVLILVLIIKLRTLFANVAALLSIAIKECQWTISNAFVWILRNAQKNARWVKVMMLPVTAYAFQNPALKVNYLILSTVHASRIIFLRLSLYLALCSVLKEKNRSNSMEEAVPVSAKTL
jgi:hypothetical protein